jgi:hypothetical protein
VPQTGQAKCYFSDGTEIPCAGTGQDGELKPGQKLPAVRFIDNKDETMTDNMTMLAEATTTRLHRDRDSKGMKPLKKDAQEGGAVAGSTRRDIEKRTGKPVVTGDNFKALTGKGKKEITYGS